MAKTRFEIEAETRDAIRQLGQLAGEFKKLGGEAERETKRASDGVSGFANIFKGTFAAGIAQSALGGVTGMIGGLATKMIQGNATMESYKTQFEVMLGSMEKATGMFEKLQKFGAETPFEFTDLAASTQVMLGFGIAEADVMKNLQMLGDVAGGSKEKLAGLTLVFSQVQSAGKLTGGDLMQMINNGFNPLKVISEQTGKSMAQLKAEMEKGAISADMVTAAFEKATGPGGQFFGMMEKQSKTFSGLLSTLQDNISQMLVAIGGPLFDAIKPVLTALVNIFSNPVVQQGITQITGALAGALVPLFERLGPVIEKLLPVLGEMLSAAAQLFGVVMKAAQPILGAIVTVVQKLAPVFVRLAGVVGKVVEALQPLIDLLVEMFLERMDLMMPLLEAFVTLVGALAPVIQLISKLLVPLIRVANEIVFAVMRPMYDMLKGIVDFGSAAIGIVLDFLGIADKPAAKKPALKTDFTAEESKQRTKEYLDSQLRAELGSQQFKSDADRAKAEAAALKKWKAEGRDMDRGMTAEGYDAAIAEAEARTQASKTKEKATSPAAGGGKGKTAKQKRDEEYQLALKNAQREEELFLLQAEKEGKSEEELHRIRLVFAQDRIDLAQRYEQSAETIRDAEHEKVKLQAERDIEIAKTAAEKRKEMERTVAEQRAKLEERYADMRRRAEERNLDLRRERMREEAEQYRQQQEEMRDAFESRFAEPVARLGTDVLTSFLDKGMTGAERWAMIWENLKSMGVQAVTEIALQFIKQQIMALATMAGIVPTQIAAAQATAAAWAPAAAGAALATFGANAIPAQAGIATTYALASALSAIPLAEGGLLNRPTFVAGERGAEVVAPLAKVPGMIAESVREAIGEKGSKSINKRGRRDGFRADVNVGIGTFGRGSRAAEFRRYRGQV